MDLRNSIVRTIIVLGNTYGSIIDIYHDCLDEVWHGEMEGISEVLKDLNDHNLMVLWVRCINYILNDIFTFCNAVYYCRVLLHEQMVQMNCTLVYSCCNCILHCSMTGKDILTRFINLKVFHNVLKDDF